jgi:hypothetical protein
MGTLRRSSRLSILLLENALGRVLVVVAFLNQDLVVRHDEVLATVNDSKTELLLLVTVVCLLSNKLLGLFTARLVEIVGLDVSVESSELLIDLLIGGCFVNVPTLLLRLTRLNPFLLFRFFARAEIVRDQRNILHCRCGFELVTLATWHTGLPGHVHALPRERLLLALGLCLSSWRLDHILPTSFNSRRGYRAMPAVLWTIEISIEV